MKKKGDDIRRMRNCSSSNPVVDWVVALDLRYIDGHEVFEVLQSVYALYYCPSCHLIDVQL